MKEREERGEKRDFCFHIRHTHRRRYTTFDKGRRTHTVDQTMSNEIARLLTLLASAGILCGYIFILRWKKDKILPSCVYNNRDDGDHKSSSRNGGAISKRRIDANHFNSPKKH